MSLFCLSVSKMSAARFQVPLIFFQITTNLSGIGMIFGIFLSVECCKDRGNICHKFDNLGHTNAADSRVNPRCRAAALRKSANPIVESSLSGRWQPTPNQEKGRPMNGLLQ